MPRNFVFEIEAGVPVPVATEDETSAVAPFATRQTATRSVLTVSLCMVSSGFLYIVCSTFYGSCLSCDASGEMTILVKIMNDRAFCEDNGGGHRPVDKVSEKPKQTKCDGRES